MSRILVIDDEDVIRMLVMEILETAGHEITGAESAGARARRSSTTSISISSSAM